MIFVPLLHYFKCKNTYSGNEYGLRYRLTPGKRSVPDPEGGEGAVKEESILTVDYWPDPWTLEMTDPALRRHLLSVIQILHFLVISVCIYAASLQAVRLQKLVINLATDIILLYFMVLK